MISQASSFATPTAWMNGGHLARVVDVQDPQGLSRVKVVMLATDPEAEAALWARVAVPFASDNCGAFFIPDVGDEVLVVFVAGASNMPIVVGSLWNGATKVPEALPGGRVDRWTITGRNGTHIAIIEDQPSGGRVEIETPLGSKAVVTDGSITLSTGTNRIRMDEKGVSIETGQKVEVKASQVDVTAGMVSVNAAFSKFSGVVQCDTLITNSVVSSAYTPGAGNVW